MDPNDLELEEGPLSDTSNCQNTQNFSKLILHDFLLNKLYHIQSPDINLLILTSNFNAFRTKAYKDVVNKSLTPSPHSVTSLMVSS